MTDYKSTEERVKERNRKANIELVQNIFLGIAILLTIGVYVGYSL